MNVTIVGTGYVGLTTGVCLAYIGHNVMCIDANEHIVNKLKIGMATIHEPGLEKLLQLSSGRLHFSTSLDLGVRDANVIVVAVGTPSKQNGDADVSAVEVVANQIGQYLQPKQSIVIINKSTVPIGSARRVEAIISDYLVRRGVDSEFQVVSNPEFLREGSAIHDTLYPDRIVVGTNSEEATIVLKNLYKPILEQSFLSPDDIPRPKGFELPKFLVTNPTSAELVKYASNCFLAMKISFINEFAGLAEKVGANINEVAHGIGLDKRIGPRFLDAGLGWGGSCFGKDTRAIVHTAKQYGHQMNIVEACIKTNYKQRLLAIEKLQQTLKVVRGCTVGILGLSFKPFTDDLRDAPAIDIINHLIEMGALVKLYDPIAMINFKKIYPNLDVTYCSDPVELGKNCDAIVIVTDWPQFKSFDWGEIGRVMRQKVLIDGRNFIDCKKVESSGFLYKGVGVS